jgi:hypothetical protein
MRLSRLLFAGTAFGLALAACGPAPVCKNNETQACYSGPANTAGVGLCRRGTQTCQNGEWSKCEGEVVPGTELCDSKDNNCNGQVDEGVKNACGGCLALDGLPGDACADCGTLACDGPDALRCTPSAPAPGSDCTGDNGCPGQYVCEAGAVRCDFPDKNECGACGGPAVANLGSPCSNGGCNGVLECNTAGDGSTCNALPKNECGVCGGPAVTGINTSCTSGTCTGKRVCNTAGNGTLCQAPGANECGVCGGAAVPGLNQSCTGANGCAGTTSCNSAGTGTVCVAPTKNNCGACAATDIPNLNGTCTATNTCPGTMICSADGKSGICSTTQTVNECGLCGGPPVTGLGTDCTTTAGCPGKLVCSAAKTGTECSGVGANNCGACGKPDVANIGQLCTSAAGCAGTYECSPTKDSAVCNAPSSCGPASHVVFSEIATGTNSKAGDDFIELYNPSTGPVDVGFYSIWYQSASTGNFSLVVSFPAGTSIGAGKHLLVARGGTSGYGGAVTADFTFTAVDMAKTAAGIWLMKPSTPSTPAPAPNPATAEPNSDPNTVDMVGWGTTSTCWTWEGATPAPAPPIDATNPNASIERKANANSTQAAMTAPGADATLGNGYDSDINGFDWVTRLARDPQNLASPAEP